MVISTLKLMLRLYVLMNFLPTKANAKTKANANAKTLCTYEIFSLSSHCKLQAASRTKPTYAV
jgi:hypothetical protein